MPIDGGNNNKSQGFSSDVFLRRIERGRKLKEIEKTFHNIAEEAKQKQEDIYINVFTEQGQAKSLENHEVFKVETVMPVADDTRFQNKENVFSRMSSFVSPKRQRNTTQAFQASPRGVASFPEIGPIGIAHQKKKSKSFRARINNVRTARFWKGCSNNPDTC